MTNQETREKVFTPKEAGKVILGTVEQIGQNCGALFIQAQLLERLLASGTDERTAIVAKNILELSRLATVETSRLVSVGNEALDGKSVRTKKIAGPLGESFVLEDV